MRDLHPDYGARSRLAFILEGVLIAAVALLVAAVFVVAIVQAQPVASSDVRVIDGDTIAVHSLHDRVRLIGFNAPETRNAACSAELQLGYRAKHRLLELVRQGPNDLRLVPCSCPPGTEGTERCNHGRRCGMLTAAGRDVGAMLIAEGLAVSFQCGETSCPPTPRPWCG
jgi:micrococcal nuclease